MVSVGAILNLQVLGDANGNRFEQSSFTASNSWHTTSSAFDGTKHGVVRIFGGIGRQDVGLSKNVSQRELLELLQSELEVLKPVRIG